jgi:hypothetical protein
MAFGVLSNPATDPRRQAFGQGVLSLGSALMQGGQGGVLSSLGRGLGAFQQGQQGALNQQRQDQLYDLQLRGLERDERKAALTEEQRDKMADAVEKYLQTNQLPPEVDSIVRTRYAGGDVDGALTAASDYVMKQMEGGGAQSGAGKLRADLEAGRITQAEYDALLKKDTYIAPQQPPAPRAPIQVYDPNTKTMVWRDPSEALGMPSKAPGEDGGGEAGFKNENTLRDEFIAHTKPVREAQVGLNKVRSAATLNTGAGDVALVFGFMKTIDPSSTVREGEFATAEQTAGVPAQITATYNNILRGVRLTPEQRQQFVQAAEQQYAVYQNQYDSMVQSYSDIAKKYMIDPSKIIVPLASGGVSAGDPTTDPNYDPLGILGGSSAK